MVENCRRQHCQRWSNALRAANTDVSVERSYMYVIFA